MSETPLIERGLLVCWLVALFGVAVLSLRPGGGPPGDHGLDKISHLIAYGALAGLPMLFASRLAVRAALVGGVLALGVGLEVAQAWVPGRQPSLWDAAANAAGVAIGVTFAVIGQRIRGRGRRRS